MTTEFILNNSAFPKRLNLQQHPFHLVTPSPWPILVSVLLAQTVLGLVWSMHQPELFIYIPIFFLLSGLIFVSYILYCRFTDIIEEPFYEGNLTKKVETSLRLVMGLFVAGVSSLNCNSWKANKGNFNFIFNIPFFFSADVNIHSIIAGLVVSGAFVTAAWVWNDPVTKIDAGNPQKVSLDDAFLIEELPLELVEQSSHVVSTANPTILYVVVAASATFVTLLLGGRLISNFFYSFPINIPEPMVDYPYPCQVLNNNIQIAKPASELEITKLLVIGNDVFGELLKTEWKPNYWASHPDWHFLFFDGFKEMKFGYINKAQHEVFFQSGSITSKNTNIVFESFPLQLGLEFLEYSQPSFQIAKILLHF